MKTFRHYPIHRRDQTGHSQFEKYCSLFAKKQHRTEHFRPRGTLNLHEQLTELPLAALEGKDCRFISRKKAILTDGICLLCQGGRPEWA